jgi:hypothetical protein
MRPSQLPVVPSMLEDTSTAEFLGAVVTGIRHPDLEAQLPFREAFAIRTSDASQPIIRREIIAAFAQLISQLTATRMLHVGAMVRSLRVDFLRDALAASALYAHGRVIGEDVHIEIHSNDDRILIARAIAMLTAPHVEGEVPPSGQPIYPC